MNSAINVAKKKRSKNMDKIYSDFQKDDSYKLEEAVEILKKTHYVKFNSTVELAVRLNIDTRKTDQTVRGTTVLPYGTGKKIRICVICDTSQYEEAKKAGADKVGGEDIVEEIKKGIIDFDVCIASPYAMRFMGAIAKILGPKGLMPNPKLGTLTPKIGKAVEESKAGKIEFKADKYGIVHLGIAKLDFDQDKILKNIMKVLKSLMIAQPKELKGKYIKSIFLTTTMGPGVKINLKNIALDNL